MENSIQDSVNREIKLMQIGMVWYVQNKNSRTPPRFFLMSALIRKLYENGLLTAEVTEMELTYLGTAVLDFLPCLSALPLFWK